MENQRRGFPFEFFQRIVRDAPDAVVFADQSGIVRFWNRGAEEIFGHAEDEAIGQSLDLIIPQGLRERHWQGFHGVMQQGKESRYGRRDLLRVPAMRKDGARISVEFSLQIVEWNGERLAVATLRDATEQWETERELRRRLEDLES